MKEFLSYAKCIISGEHAVIRGGKALVYPLKSCYLKAQFEESDGELKVLFKGEYGHELKLIFWGILEEALGYVSKTRSGLSGVLTIEDEIPTGGGLGASAAVCAFMAKWFLYLGFIEQDEVFAFARKLENIFHGKSSGVDIAASISEGPIQFQDGKFMAIQGATWHPHWYLSYSGERGITSECIQKVENLRLDQFNKFQYSEHLMNESTSIALQALKETQEEKGFELMRQAMEKSCESFRNWNLISFKMEELMRNLMDEGASAVKPTGSGGGGYILSLWNHKLPNEFQKKWKMISLK